ncbi:hypothetical protein BZG36_04121 [Bifiguratus adelaidae]|uniref:EF-hand domain-containing protein n=1 Tax=Bifiguratus adelaidae TaxID=1938954 RepID=A0A261XX75_9FUNG|nr:hypothetical protein BZG36_04121 [Bifiguratus adelaidae]
MPLPLLKRRKEEKKRPLSFGADQLTPAQFQDCKAAFEMFDTNHDGSISATELDQVLKRMGIHLTEVELHCWIDEVDCDGNGVIDLAEFLSMMQRHQSRSPSPQPQQDLLSTFRIFDQDNNGVITKGELTSTMRLVFNMPLSDAEIEEMMLEADTNKDGVITFDEFVVMMASQLC